MAVNMVTLPEPESGTKRPKLTSKESQIFYNRQRNCYDRGTGKELQKSAHVFRTTILSV